MATSIVVPVVTVGTVVGPASATDGGFAQYDSTTGQLIKNHAATIAIGSEVSGLGTGVGTFLGTPSSANLASAVTGETGSGALVFADTPTLVTPNIGAATGTSLNLSQTISTTGKYATYNNVVTAGLGIPSVYGYGDVATATNTGTASIATYTVGAADGTFEISTNCLVTTSTNHTFSLDVTYTDEGNSARTLVLPVALTSAGSFVTAGLITNITGAGPYVSPTMTIRAKAATAITIRTSAGGTFTTVVYNARGVIKQVG